MTLLSPGAPQGATCIDGQWSPTEVPQCHPEQHPRIRNVIIIIHIHHFQWHFNSRWLDKRSVKESDLQEVIEEAESQNTTPGPRVRRSVDSSSSCPPLDLSLMIISKVTSLWMIMMTSQYLILISLGTRTLPPPPARATMSTGPTSGSSVRMDTRWPSGQTGQWQMMAQWVLIRWSRGNNMVRGRQYYSYSLVNQCFDRPREDCRLSVRSNTTFILFKLWQNFCECLVLQMSTFRLFGIKSSNFPSGVFVSVGSQWWLLNSFLWWHRHFKTCVLNIHGV